LDILLYTHSFAGGGAERVTVQLANHWASRGVSTAMAVNLDEGPLRADVSPEVEVIALGQRRGAMAIPGLVRLLADRRPRAMVSGMTTQNIAASIANRIVGRRTRLVVTEHISLISSGRSHAGMNTRARMGLLRLSYPFAHVVSAVSAACARDLDRRLGRPEGSTAVVYNPIWPPERTPGVAPADVHPWFGGDDPVVVNVARLERPKNHHNLIDAVAIARKTRPVRAIVLGEGSLRAELEAYAVQRGVAEHVDFPGFKRNVGDYLAETDLFVLSSDTEGLPLALMEALYMGTPVVSTNCQTGPDELLQDGAYGALVPTRDPEALAQAMIEALDAPVDRARLQRRAAEFSIDAIARRYEALLFDGGNVIEQTPLRRAAT
jgi:glycosyltransferase involved in cell wall biosynthesis